MTAINLPVSAVDWTQYLQTKQTIAKTAIYEYAVSIHEFKNSCEIKSGGTQFTEKCSEWLDMSKSTAHEFAKIGGSIKLSQLNANNMLPVSKQAMYELTKLSDSDFDTALKDGAITPDLSRNDVKKLQLSNRSESSDELKVSLNNCLTEMKIALAAQYGQMTSASGTAKVQIYDAAESDREFINILAFDIALGVMEDGTPHGETIKLIYSRFAKNIREFIDDYVSIIKVELQQMGCIKKATSHEIREK